MTTHATTSAPTTPRFVLNPITGAYFALIVSLIVLSFAAVMMRLAQVNGIPSSVIAAVRLTLAGLILTPLILMRHRDDLKRLSRDDLRWSIFSGIWIGVHFLFITVSLEHTTILISQVIVNTSPLWVTILETVFLKTKLSRTLYVAVIVTMVGGALIALASAMNAVNPPAEVLLNAGGFEGVLNGDYDRNPILGAVLALVGAIAGSIYITIGRKARANVPTMPYVWIVFSVGGLVAFGAVLFNRVPLLGYPMEGYGWLLALTIVPHLIGHSSFNHALRFFSATMVSIAGQAITVSAAVVAFFIFAEVPGWLEVIGSAIIMFGVTMAIMASQHKRWKQNQAERAANG